MFSKMIEAIVALFLGRKVNVFFDDPIHEHPPNGVKRLFTLPRVNEFYRPGRTERWLVTAVTHATAGIGNYSITVVREQPELRHYPKTAD